MVSEMVCFSSYALITEQVAAAKDVRFFGQKAFGSVGSREKKRHISNVPLQGSSTIYLVVAKLAAHAHRKLSAVVQKSFARRSFLLMQYATCTANRPTSIGSSSNGLTAHSSTGKSLSEALLFAEQVVYKNCSECQKQFLYTTCSSQVWAWNFNVLDL